MIHWKKLSVEIPPPDAFVIIKIQRPILVYPMIKEGDFHYTICWLEAPSSYKFASPAYLWMNVQLEVEVEPDDEWVLLQ